MSTIPQPINKLLSEKDPQFLIGYKVLIVQVKDLGFLICILHTMNIIRLAPVASTLCIGLFMIGPALLPGGWKGVNLYL